jgi:hypothetical protein
VLRGSGSLCAERKPDMLAVLLLPLLLLLLCRMTT